MKKAIKIGKPNAMLFVASLTAEALRRFEGGFEDEVSSVFDLLGPSLGDGFITKILV